MSLAPLAWSSYVERLNVQTAKAQFDDAGYVRADAYFSAEEIATVRDELERYKREVIQRVPQKFVFYEDKSRPTETLIRLERMMTFDEFFSSLSKSPAINGLADKLLGTECEPNNVQYFSKPPGAKPTPYHQDGQYFMHDKGLTFWLALDDVDEVNGCMYYVPGSHKYGLLPHHKSNALGFSQALTKFPSELLNTDVCMRATAGTLLAHHPHTIHNAGGNRDSTRWRPALGLTFWAKKCGDDVELQARHEEYQEMLAEQLQRDGKI
ncbi:probable alpha-ketoglutarate-dependent hypophosphite dioxygenase [Corticium candelabrum]|uniref:probable alpha-ketoglutarate-dependent hypophosphite dioxygenase n=1 Tax=Corticium candelabrum TaxID=121492 RepID=UPI002E26B0D0|nr:probable alpha-ketoglutarate-dependent hypophosphite dioxygenase [Corticium candelabrum]